MNDGAHYSESLGFWTFVHRPELIVNPRNRSVSESGSVSALEPELIIILY
jgi:hypothetical protein